VKCWNIYFNYFIYKPEAPDDRHEYIHLVNLENKNSMILIEDFVHDPDCKLSAQNYIIQNL
jgi:hypothetical protein